MPRTREVADAAALAICEPLLLASNARSILPKREIVGILRDAAAGHDNAPKNDPDRVLHKAVTVLINGTLAGGNSMRRR